MNKERLFWIDAAKGIGITLMVLGHMHIGDPIRNFIYSFHMPMFIMISGYLFRADGPFKDIVLRKAKGLLLPFVYTNLITLLIRWALLFVSGNFTPAGALGIAKMQALITLGAGSFYRTILVFIETAGPIWFVPFLFSINIIFAIFAKIRKKKSLPGEILELVAVIALGYLGYHIGTKVAFLPWSFDSSLVALIVFYVGIKLRQCNYFESKHAPVISIVLGIFWILCYDNIGMAAFATREYFNYPFCLVVAVAGSIFLIYAIRFMELKLKLTPLLKPIAWCGRHSMLILAIHTVEFVHINWNETIQAHFQNRLLSYIAYMGIILIIAWGWLLALRIGKIAVEKLRNK